MSHGLYVARTSFVLEALLATTPAAALTTYATRHCTTWLAGMATSYLSFNALKFGSDMLLQAYGAQGTAVVWNELQRFREARSSKAVSHDALRRDGSASDAIARMEAMPAGSRGVLLVVLGLFTTYVHLLGMMHMRSKPRPEADKQQLAAAAPPIGLPPNLKSEYQAWRDLQARAAHEMERDAKLYQAKHDGQPTADVVLESNGSLLEQYIESFYRGEPYYDPTNKRASILGAPTPQTAVRMAINFLVGLWLQVGALLGTSKDKALTNLTHTMSLLGLWEALTLALRLYGWGPMYLALKFTMRLLMPS